MLSLIHVFRIHILIGLRLQFADNICVSTQRTHTITFSIYMLYALHADSKRKKKQMILKHIHGSEFTLHVYAEWNVRL